MLKLVEFSLKGFPPGGPKAQEVQRTQSKISRTIELQNIDRAAATSIVTSLFQESSLMSLRNTINQLPAPPTASVRLRAGYFRSCSWILRKSVRRSIPSNPATLERCH